MNHVSLEKAKSYSKIYFTEADDEVARLVAAAEAWLAQFWGYDTLSDDALLLEPLADPPADSPGAQELRTDVELCVLMVFDDYWQNRGMQIVGTIVTANPTFLRVANTYRRNLGV